MPVMGPPWDEPDPDYVHTSFIDRMCEHGNEGCPNGCHDYQGYAPSNEGVALMIEIMAWMVNHDGDLHPFHAHRDAASGKDGLDEAAESALMFLLLYDDEFIDAREDL